MVGGGSGRRTMMGETPDTPPDDATHVRTSDTVDTLRNRVQVALGQQFQIGRELGGGGMSRVFVARDITLDREVVVKVLSPELVQELSVERFAREITLAAALQHANIVPLLSAGVTDNGLPYYLMPFVEGSSLRDVEGGTATMPIADVLVVLNDVCRALAYAHGRGVVHRDIKPDNVMLSGGAALVTDFGIAKAMRSARQTPSDDHLTRMGTSIGSPAYMAPEQGAGDPDTDHRADLYALGAVAYEMLTGAPPFGNRPAHAQLVAHLSETPRPVQSLRTDTPDALARFVMQCLEKDPADRPQQATDALELLADAAAAARADATGQYTTTARGAALGDTRTIVGPLSPRRRSRGTGLAIAGLVLIATSVGWWTLRRRASVVGPDPSLLAVMPFTVREPSLAVWREGLVDILARRLDGAGSLRTVAPTTSIANSPARSDPVTATALGRTLGAGVVLFGDVSTSGRDSVRLSATVVDVASGKPLYDVAVSGETLRMDALADSLSLRLLRDMGTSGALTGGARVTSLGTSSLPALKAYLQGQQYMRRSSIDSSLAAFEAAVAADSTFSLGWRGVASVYIRTGREAAPEAQRALDLAIRYKQHGSPRDSMLLRADSIRLGVVRRTPTATDAIDDVPAVRALLETLQAATQRYPSDPELWMERGDAAFHFGALAGIADSVAMRDFERAMALDSLLFVPSVHAHTLAMRAGRFTDAARFAHRLGRLLQGQNAVFYETEAVLLDSFPRVRADAQQRLDAAGAQFAAVILRELGASPEAAPLLRALAQQQTARLRAGAVLADSTALSHAITYAMAMTGSLTASVAERLSFPERAQAAQAGLLPTAAVASEARRLIVAQPTAGSAAFSLFAAERDTASLRLLERAFDSVDASARAATRSSRYGDLVRAWIALARGDSSAALRGFLTLPMAMCNSAPCSGTMVARLLVKAGRDKDAARVLDRWLPSGMSTFVGPVNMLLRGELAERASDRSLANLWYRRVVAQWGLGDASVQSTVQAARTGATRTKSP